MSPTTALSSSGPPGTGTTQCVGRDSELARLMALYESIGDRGEHLVLLEGPRGVGKSRILDELRSRVRLSGGVVLEGYCEHGGAFAPFTQIVENALHFLREVGRESGAENADLSCVGGCHRLWFQHDESAPLERHEGHGRISTSTPGAENAALEGRMRLFDGIRALLREVSEVRPPVVILHDLERADQGTHDLLRYLFEGTGPFRSGTRGDELLRALFVASVRAAAANDHVPALVELRAARSTELLEVGMLNADGVRALLQCPEVVQRVLERTGGMPEVIDLLLEADPLTPEVRLDRRMKKLSLGARSLLEALSVIERPVDLDLLARMTTGAADAAACAELGRSELVARSIVDGKILCRFVRDADREIVYRALSNERRRSLHLRALEIMRNGHGDAQEATRHALAGGALKEAEPLALEAARSLAGRHAHAQAATLLESLGEGGVALSIRVREQLAELYRLAGEYKRALTHARAARDELPAEPGAARRLGEILMLAGEHSEAAEMLEDARRLATASNDVAAVAEVDALLAELHYQNASFTESRRFAEIALEEAELLGALPLALAARNTLGKLALAQRDAQTAAALFEENRRRAAASGLGHQEAQALTNEGVAHLRRQDLAAAEAAFVRAIEVADGANDTRESAIATENLAVLAHLRRDYKRAQTHYHAAVGQLKRLGNRAMLARVANNLGALYLSLGDHARARTLCDFATHLGGAALPASVVGEALMLRGRVEMAEGHAVAARATLGAAQATFERIGHVHAADAILDLARLDLVDGNVARARQLLLSLPTPDSTKREAEIALLATDLERAAGNDALASARHALALAEISTDEELILPALLRLARAHADRSEASEALRAIDRAREMEARVAERVPEDAQQAFAARPDHLELVSLEGRIAASLGTSARDSSLPPRLTSTARARTVEDPRLRLWRERYPDIVGSSPGITQILSVLDKAAPSDCLVLIRGESGTGKELIAEALHNNSRRRDKPLVKVNCGALVETLLLSELFGHERGAFTGAQARRKGRFELADGGTLFLDEIGDISPKTQVALLRVLQEREFERVGGTQAIKVDVRIVAATHRDLEKMVREGTFREDLYYRLRGVMIEMPPLRKRAEDLAELCGHFLERIARERGETPKRLAPDALKLLGGHRWPGNIRELDNVLRSATLFADASVLGAQELAAFAETFQATDPEPELAVHRRARASDAPPADVNEIDIAYQRIREGATSLFDMKKELERECISRALAETNGNITRAAALLGMKRPRLSQLVKQYGLFASGEA